MSTQTKLNQKFLRVEAVANTISSFIGMYTDVCRDMLRFQFSFQAIYNSLIFHNKKEKFFAIFFYLEKT